MHTHCDNLISIEKQIGKIFVLHYIDAENLIYTYIPPFSLADTKENIYNVPEYLNQFCKAVNIFQ